MTQQVIAIASRNASVTGHLHFRRFLKVVFGAAIC
jgi:hypothetical protein